MKHFFASMETYTSKDVWFIDLGASFHMYSHRGWFIQYTKYDDGNVYLGDDSYLNIFGHGRVKIRFLDDKVKGINDVLHILVLEWNLLYVSILNDLVVYVFSCNEDER